MSVGRKRLPEVGFNIFGNMEISGKFRAALPKITPDQTKRKVIPTASSVEKTRNTFRPRTPADLLVRRILACLFRKMREMRSERLDMDHQGVCEDVDLAWVGLGDGLFMLVGVAVAGGGVIVLEGDLVGVGVCKRAMCWVAVSLQD